MAFNYDAKGLDLKGTTFPVVPIGNYTLQITEVKEKTTKKGDPMVNAKCEIVGGEYAGKTIYHNVTFLPKERPGAGMAVNFLKNIGEPWENDFEVNPDNWIGKKFDCKVKVEKDDKGRDRNAVAYVIERLGDDEVPF